MRFFFLLLLLASGGLGYWYYDSYKNEAGVTELQNKIHETGSEMERIDNEMKSIHGSLQKLDEELSKKKEEIIVQNNIRETNSNSQRVKLVQQQKILDEQRLAIDQKFKQLLESLNEKIRSLRGEVDTAIAKDRERIFEMERRKSNVSHSSKVDPAWPAQKAKLVSNMNTKHDRLRKNQEKAEEKLIEQIEQAEKNYKTFLSKNTKSQQALSKELDKLNALQEEAKEVMETGPSKQAVAPPIAVSPLQRKRMELDRRHKELQRKYDNLNREANVKLKKELDEKQDKLSDIKTWTYILCGFWGVLTLLAFSSGSHREA